MTDFSVDPDADPEPSASPGQLRLVEVGHDPLGEKPPSRGAPAPPPASGPCACGVLVLHGVTLAGACLTLEPGIPTFAVTWGQGAALPTFLPSRAYPVHQCRKEMRTDG